MKARVRKKDIVQTTDRLQDELELVLAEVAQKYLELPEVKKCKLSQTQEQDIIAGALLTLFTKNLAYLSVKEKGFDHQTYLQGVFDSMAHLFAKSRENFVEVLKDKDEKNSSAH
jgi:predicted translin family RNA/ssDNA-binding protein